MNTARSVTSSRGGGNNNRANSPHRYRTGPWMKTHPLEGDGLITGFYNFLNKRNAKDMKACVDVFIPDTIVYDHNFPRGWYTTDIKSREIMKRQGKELDSATILKYFEQPSSKNWGIVASYMSCTEDDDITTTHVEFFNQRTLKEFIERKTKREGILQKFVVPKGGSRNTVIQAVWSPRVLCVWRRQNRNHLDNKSQCDRDPYPIAVTYDGPSHYSEESTCAANTTEEIKSICGNIVRHFYQTMEHKFLTRMVLYFKVDENDQVWLLWCGSLRVADKDRLDPVTLNFAPRHDNLTVDARKEEWENEQLHAMDERYVNLAHDALFTSKYIDNDKNSPSSTMNSRRSPTSTMGGTARSHIAGGGTATTRSTMLGGFHESGKDYEDGDGSNNNNARRKGDGSNNNGDEAWHRNPSIHDAYVDLCTSREKVLAHVDDIFYEAYGHFLRYDPGSFTFSVDKGVARTLGHDALGEAMLAGGVQKSTPSSDTAVDNNLDDDDLCFEIPGNKQQRGPVTKIGDAVKAWINKHYDKLILDLKEEAASILPSSSATAAQQQQSSGSTTNNNKEDTEASLKNSTNQDVESTPQPAEKNPISNPEENQNNNEEQQQGEGETTPTNTDQNNNPKTDATDTSQKYDQDDFDEEEL